MSSLLSTIRTDQLAARKEHNAPATALLTTLLSEASMPGKNAGRESTEAEVAAVIKKFLNGVDETLKAIGPGNEHFVDDRVAILSYERDLLNKYLPKQLTEAELRVIITDFIDILGDSSPKAMGKIMGMIKNQYAGTYDGTLASKILKELLR